MTRLISAPSLAPFALLVGAPLTLALSCATSEEPRPPPPAAAVVDAAPAPPWPVAKKVPHVRELHGDRFVDDYFWLREKGSPEVEAHLHAEDAYADRVMAPLAPLVETLYAEIVSHQNEDDESVPVKDGAYLYWYRLEKGKDYAIHLRRKVTPKDAPEEVLLDENVLAEGKEHFDIGALEVSDDGQRLLFTTDEVGFREYTLQFMDLATRVVHPERIPHVTSATWASDNATVFYTVEDDAKRSWRAYRHVVGTDPTTDTLVFDEADARFYVWVERSQSRAFVILTSASQTTSEVRVVDAAKPATPPALIEPRRDGVEYYLEHRGATFVIMANDTGRNFRLVEAKVGSPGRAGWKELRAHSDDVMIQGIAVFKTHTVLALRDGGLPHLEVMDAAHQSLGRIPMPEADYSVGLGDNPEWDTGVVRFSYQSLSTPRSTFVWELKTKKVTLEKETPVPGGFDRARYRTEYLHATATDGTLIPISLVVAKDAPTDGSVPLHLNGYGAYGFPYPSSFSAARLVMLDRGVAIAYCHARGGGEMGKRWHDEGRMAQKMNTFTDFIACAEHLIANGYTSRERLTIEGGSAGGLLMGAVLNLRPDLFKAAIVDVPFVDVINTMSDETLPLTVTEYEEWGNPQKPEEYAWIRAYSPYENIAATAYPAMLVRTSYHDSQVMYFEPAKYVARLRAHKTDDHPLLFKIHMEPAGHGGKSGRYAAYRDVAFDDAFLLWQMGVVGPDGAPSAPASTTGAAEATR